MVQFGNVVMIVVGILLTASGPYIGFRTVRGVLDRRRVDPKSEIHPISNGLNLLIAVLFFLAGILFVLNNLRGNPLP